VIAVKFLKILAVFLFLVSFVLAKPVADFTFNPVSGDAPLRIYFDASNSIDAVDYIWSIDGIEQHSDEHFQIVFSEPGEHIVNLTVTDADGVNDSVIKKLVLTDNGLVSTYLNVKPPVFDEETGLYKFEASANDNGFCQDASVFMRFNGGSYKMDKGVDCHFSKYLKLPAGDYDIDFDAVFSDSHRHAFCSLSVDEGKTAFINVYSPQENTVFKKDAVAYVEAVFVYGSKNIRSGTGVVKLVNSSGFVFNQQKLSLYYPGAFKGFIPLNVTSGNYSLAVEIKYNDFDLVKDVPVSVSETQSENSISNGPSIYLVEPGVFNYSLNSSVSFEVNFFDERGLLISDADAVMKIKRYGEDYDSVEMTAGRFSYEASYFFNESGDYSVEFHLEKGNEKAVKTIFLIVGNSTQLAEVENFTVNILSPLPEVYVENSSLNIRTLVLYNDVRLPNASVYIFLNDEKHEMSYDSYGEYAYSTPRLSSGDYSLKAVAKYLDLTAVAETSFQISPHVLNFSIVSPYENESIELNKSKGVLIKVDLLDEENRSVPGALVIGSIVEPSGRTIKADFSQNEQTGLYESIFYPNDEGVYKIDLQGFETGFVNAHYSYEFDVNFYKEKFEVPEFSLEALMIVALAVAILVMIVILLKFIF